MTVSRSPQHRWLPLVLLAISTVGTMLLWLAVGLGGLLTGGGFQGNPVSMPLQLALGTVTWPGTAAWAVLAGLMLLLAGPATLALVLIARKRRGQTRVDPGARSLARPADLGPYTPDGVHESATRLRPGGVNDDPNEHGVLVGTTVPGGIPFRSGWEDTEIDIWGPRTGKTTTRAVPSIVSAPGAVLATSNKRDLHDATRGVREKVGRCWVFDPQGIVYGPPEFWFNPLRRVAGPRQAAELVGHFVAGTRAADARTDAYFDGEGENLVSYFFLAAARGEKTLDVAYQWAADSRFQSREALDILKHSGDTLIAKKLESLLGAPDKQREGVFSAGLKLLRCLEDPDVLTWVTPPGESDEHRPEFDPHTFLASKDTIYLLSMEGEGSAGPLVAALTFDILEAGKDLARGQPGARLDPPLLCVLDEAANVVRIRELPNLYSHFGSRGMLVMTILQSWEQGVEVWGKSGMQKLWDAANVRVYGGGSADSEFLGKLAKLIGKHHKEKYSISYDPTRPTTHNKSWDRQEIYEIADLAALPRGRVIVIASGVPPVLVQPVPWMNGPHAEAVRASLARHTTNHGLGNG